MYKIELAKIDEIYQIKKIYNLASEFLKNNNVDQWQNDYPSIEIIQNDILKQQLYVLKEENELLGVMAFLKEEEPTYKNIYNGKWKTNNIYYTIHRITVINKGKGLSKYLFDFAFNICLKDKVTSLRIDTHINNLVMQKTLKKYGFKYCGLIYLLDGSERIAFEKEIIMNYETFERQIFSTERALYNKKDIILKECSISGEEDGESALKECDNVIVEKTLFDLRYPIWHTHNISLKDIEMTLNCRAPMWYSNEIIIESSKLNCVKGLRECSNIEIKKSEINSQEYAWKCKNINVNDSSLSGEYMFLDSQNINLNNVNFNGKYSFQYVKNLNIMNSKIITKDAFWHASNVIVKDSYIKGEYLGWYSKNLTFINCTIEGTQPLCYCEGLVLENCKMINCDLSFEYSDVNAIIDGDVLSIKNPLKGRIQCGKNTEIILENSKYIFEGEIINK